VTISLEVLPNPERAAAHAAERITQWLSAAILERGQATLALSGGTTPAAMLSKFAEDDIDWTRVHVFQVDERVVAADDESRNLRGMIGSLSPRIVESVRIHAMPVESDALGSAAVKYSELLRSVTGLPPVLDVVQLGLGADGHTASLVPGDAALDATDDVAVAGPYQGFERMTLTLPAINRAWRRLFLVTGASKQAALRQLIAGDGSIVASRVARESTVIVADEAASRGD